MIIKVSYGSIERLLVTAFFQQSGWRSWDAAKIRLNCSLISNAAVKETQDKVVVPGLEILSMISSSMEEADERIFVHVKHAL